MPLYDQIGIGYDSTRRADPYIVGRLLHHLQAEKTGTYLDVACGTGNYTIALANAGLVMHGLDQSARMIATAQQKNYQITWHIGSAEALPFPDGTFSGAICTLAIHHFPDLLPAFRETFRVLARGRIVLFTATPEQMRGYWLNEYFPTAMAKSIAQMPSLNTVMRNLRSAGFSAIRAEPYVVRHDLQDLFLYSGKHRPEIYLDSGVRAGISTITALADAREVEQGCKRLASDIRSGRIADVTAAYRHDQGDYLFVVAAWDEVVEGYKWVGKSEE